MVESQEKDLTKSEEDKNWSVSFDLDREMGIEEGKEIGRKEAFVWFSRRPVLRRNKTNTIRRKTRTTPFTKALGNFTEFTLPILIEALLHKESVLKKSPNLSEFWGGSNFLGLNM